MLQSTLLAQQMPIKFHLCPMQGTFFISHGVQVTPEGFDLFQQVFDRVIAVGSTAHPQQSKRAFQRDFGFVVRAPARRDDGMAGNAFLRRRRGREAQVQVAVLCCELAQCTNRDGAGRLGRVCCGEKVVHDTLAGVGKAVNMPPAIAGVNVAGHLAAAQPVIIRVDASL